MNYAASSLTPARTLRRLATYALLTIAPACAPLDDQPEGDGEDATEPPAAAADASDDLVFKGFLQASKQSHAELFSWSGLQLSVPMRPIASHACFLSRVSGNLGGNSVVIVHGGSGEFQSTIRGSRLPRTTAFDPNGTWKLDGLQVEENSLSAEAICVPLADFHGDPGAVVWQAQTFGVFHDLERWPGCSISAATDTFNGDAATFLLAIQGEFDGAEVVAEIVDGPRNAPSQLRIKSNQCGSGMAAFANSLFVGVPGKTTMWRSNHQLSAKNNRTATKNMMPTRNGVCYLHRVSGNFDGAQDRVRIFPTMDASGIEWWSLEATANEGVSVTAQCIYYDQSSGCAGPNVPCI